MCRSTRLASAMSERVETHRVMASLCSQHFNVGPIHTKLRVLLARETGFDETVGDSQGFISLIDARAPKLCRAKNFWKRHA